VHLYEGVNPHVFPQNSKNRSSGRSGRKNSEQQIVSHVIKTMEKRKQPKQLPDVLSTSVSATSQFHDFTGTVAQGVAVYQRVGQSIRVSHISLKGILTSADATQVMRIIVFRWNVSDSSDAPAVSELLDTAGGTIPDYVANYLIYKPSRFTILWDETFIFSSNWQPLQKFEKEIKCNSLVEYDVGVNTGKNHIYMMITSDSGAVTHPSCYFSSCPLSRYGINNLFRVPGLKPAPVVG